MLDKLSQRSFLSPALAFTFVPVALSGLLMLFHVRFDGLKNVHQWVGLAFTVFGAYHLAVNWKPFAKYLSNRDARIALALAAALTLGCAVLGQDGDGGWGHQGSRNAMTEARHR